MKKTLTALLCSLFLLAPCSVAQTFTFETGRNGTGIVFGTDGYSSEVGVTTPYVRTTYSNGYYDASGYWHPHRKHHKHNKSCKKYRKAEKKYYKQRSKAYKHHQKAVRKARKAYYKEMRKAYRD